MGNELATQQTTMQALVPRSIPEAVQLAETMSKSSLIPSHLQNKPGDCMLVVMQAQRWGMDALSVAQCTSVVHGRLCYEGKLVAAVLYGMGAIEGRLTYEIKGKGQGASITVTGVPRGGDGTKQTVTGSVADWRTYAKDKQTGAKIPNAWDNIPEDMLVYRGTRQWARRYAPEALLGIYTPDEFEDEPAAPTTATVVQMPQAKTPAPTPAPAAAAAPAEDAQFTPTPAPAPSPAAAPAPPPSGEPGLHNLSNSQKAILLARAKGVGLSEAALLDKYKRIDLSNLNVVLAELREMQPPQQQGAA